MTTGYRQPVIHTMVTTGFELDNFHVVRNLGVVRGIVVRSRAVFGTMNKIGAMRGNKETAKGRSMEKKHERDATKPHRQSFRD